MNSQQPDRDNMAASTATLTPFITTFTSTPKGPFPSRRHWTPGRAGKGVALGKNGVRKLSSSIQPL